MIRKQMKYFSNVSIPKCYLLEQGSRRADATPGGESPSGRPENKTSIHYTLLQITPLFLFCNVNLNSTMAVNIKVFIV